MKILALPKKKNYKLILSYFITIILYSLLDLTFKIEMNTTIYTTICVSIIHSIVYKFKITYSALIALISMSIIQIMLAFTTIILYIPTSILNITETYTCFVIINIIQFILLILFWRIKRIHNGITFLKKWKDDEYINLMLLNISSGILFIAVIISNYQEGVTSRFGIMLIIFAIVMFITIWKSLQLYYRQQMLEKTLKQTQEELNNKNKEIEKLEAEI